MKAFDSYKIEDLRRMRERGGEPWRDLIYAFTLWNSYSQMMGIRLNNR